MPLSFLATAATIGLTALLAPTTQPGDGDLPETTPNVGHERHLHPHNDPLPRAADASRFHTNRPGALDLPLPEEQDAFTFVVYGDRTGGPDEGVAVLADAVRDTNLLEPDLVMTVGDLVQGYNEPDQWMRQMREFKGVMNTLVSPWFPVAGNHDIYWRDRGEPGPAIPPGQHEANYEMHFGPLWYAFEHKNSLFVVLYSDEGNPETGEKAISKPESQRMSPEQLQWLQQTLADHKDSEHVFLFLHHPRWITGRYGDDWEKVHKALVEAGNVTAVFAGHIHRMRYDGPRDGIEYVTLATVGGHNAMTVPEAGMLHQYHVVTVRKDRVAMTALPVGAAMDVREITPELAADAESLATLAVDFSGDVELNEDGAADAELEATVTNPTNFSIDLELAFDSDDSRWVARPDHGHLTLKPGESATLPMTIRRTADALDDAYRAPTLLVRCDLLAPATRYKIPEHAAAVPVRLPSDYRPGNGVDRVLQLAGDAAVVVSNADLDLPQDGSLTLEAWFNGDDFAGRRGLAGKAQLSDYGLFVTDGRPSFSVMLGEQYTTVRGKRRSLRPGQWHHVAGVYDRDANAVRLFLDGELVAEAEAPRLPRRTNELPLIVGADVDGDGAPVDYFSGRIGDVRLSNSARYADAFEPAAALPVDERTLLHLDMDGRLGTALLDTTPRRVRAEIDGDVELVESDLESDLK